MFLLSQRHFEGKKDNTLVTDNSIIGFRRKMPHSLDIYFVQECSIKAPYKKLLFVL